MASVPYVFNAFNTTTYEYELVPTTQMYFESTTQKVVVTAIPIDDTDIVNKLYVDEKVAALEARLQLLLTPGEKTNES